MLLLWIETDPVVPHLQRDPVPTILEPYPDLVGMGVLDDVVECLLGDPVDSFLDLE